MCLLSYLEVLSHGMTPSVAVMDGFSVANDGSEVGRDIRGHCT